VVRSERAIRHVVCSARTVLEIVSALDLANISLLSVGAKPPPARPPGSVPPAITDSGGR
jgi:hypothetical protein